MGIVIETRLHPAGQDVIDRFLRDAKMDIVPVDAADGLIEDNAALDPVRGMRVSSLLVCLAVPIMSQMFGSTLVSKPQCARSCPDRRPAHSRRLVFFLEPDVDITVPNIGHFVDVLVIEVHVSTGDVVAAEDPLITLESDKATLDIPAPVAGTVAAVRVAVGDNVSAGHVIADLRTGRLPVPAQPQQQAP